MTRPRAGWWASRSSMPGRNVETLNPHKSVASLFDQPLAREPFACEQREEASTKLSSGAFSPEGVSVTTTRLGENGSRGRLGRYLIMVKWVRPRDGWRLLPDELSGISTAALKRSGCTVFIVASFAFPRFRALRSAFGYVRRQRSTLFVCCHAEDDVWKLTWWMQMTEVNCRECRPCPKNGIISAEGRNFQRSRDARLRQS